MSKLLLYSTQVFIVTFDGQKDDIDASYTTSGGGEKGIPGAFGLSL